MILEDLRNREPVFLEMARKKINGHRTWVCPNCGNGKGKDGDGISLDPNSKNTPHYKCFRCGIYCDVVDLFRYHKGLSDSSEAFKALCEYFGYREFHENGHYDGFKTRRKASDGLRHGRQEKGEATINAPEMAFHFEGKGSTQSFNELMHFFEQASENLRRTDYHRGISLETLQRFNVGFIENWRHPKAPNSKPSPRLIIPTSESSYLARSTVDDSKIKVGNVHIFNIDAIRTAQQPIFVVEGEIDALSIIDVGGEAIALGGVSNIGLLVEEISPTRGAAASSCTHYSAALASSSSDVRRSSSLPEAIIGWNVTFPRREGNHCCYSCRLVSCNDNDMQVIEVHHQ